MNTKTIKQFYFRLMLYFSIGLSAQGYAQVGPLLWEDNFDNFDQNHWNIDIGDGCDKGICGWGNQELQWYAQSNVNIEPVPGEAGNYALILEARDEASNGYAFTSGKVQSSNKVAIQYGMIEVRVLIPNVDTGLWPAVWLLGTSTSTWPAKGEIDMMEMGHSAQARADAGFPGANSNHYVGSNLIFYADAACSEGNPTCAASTAWQTDNAHVSDTPLTNRFVTYRTYWTDSQIRFTVEDNGQEIDLYDAPFTISAESDEFQAPFYLLLNLAVGGLFTDAHNNAQVTAPKPAKMMVDYVRVYQLDGQGQVMLGDNTPLESGTFGVFTDTTPTSNKLEAGVSSDIHIWNQNTIGAGTLAPAEGSNVIAWQYTSANEWFGGGIQTRQARNMSQFSDGHLSFKIKIPADVAFKVGIADTYTNENWIDFPAFQSQYGMNRDGEWAQVNIPIAEMRGSLVAIQSIKNHFMIASIDGNLPTSTFEFAIDDILWTGGGDNPVSDADGDGVNDVNDNCPNTPAGSQVDAFGCVVVQDSDNDGVADEQDLCPDTPANTEVDSNGCALIVTPDGLRVIDQNTVEFYVYTAAWADVHYRLNSGNQQNFRMVSDGVQSTWSLSGLNDGDLIEFAFTYQANDGWVGTTEWQSFSFTTTTSNDSDNDGVPDAQDQCPGTSQGVSVDSNGCEIVVPPGDADSDGVTDDIDQCPNTPAGDAVDSQGCSVVNNDVTGLTESTDGSSVTFFVNTTGWADVHYLLNNNGQQNFRMTQTGTANQFVLSGLVQGDQIQYWFTYETSNGQEVTASRTHVMSGDSQSGGQDADNDGVEDSVDQCANTPAGATVDANGCEITNNEKLGYESHADSVTFFVNVNGWADLHYRVNSGNQQNFRMVHTSNRNEHQVTGLQAGDQVEYAFTYLDDDGVVKVSDWQQFQFGGSTSESDADNDGVPDTLDNCPNTPSGTTVDSNGCAVTNDPDSDNDGVVDSQDQCPGTPAGTSVDSQGCSLVSDAAEVTIANGLLVGGAGSTQPDFTIYVFDNDVGSGTSTCVDACAGNWPPLLLNDDIASGISGLSFITREDGTRQVTFDNRPLYFFAGDAGAGDTQGQGVGGVWWTVSYGSANIVPLYDSNTVLEPATSFDRGDALVTRFADRARDRHAKEDQFQAYDHYLSHYWTHRTARFQFEDYVAKGGDRIELTYVTEWRLDFPHEFRAWYNGIGTVAQYHGNYGTGVAEEGPGTWDDNFNKISDSGDQYKYTLTINDYRPLNWDPASGYLPLQVGQRMEFEPSQFLLGVPEGRDNYYGTTYLYMVGQGLVPWRTVGSFENQSSEREDSYPVAESARLGGQTTLPYMYTAEPDNHFMQMATNLSNINGQAFVLGRRLHHTHFGSGQHDELPENGVFPEQVGKLGNHYVNHSCSGCHVRNGRASVANIGEPLDKWVFKVADIDGNADPDLGRVLQPNNVNVPAGQGEGSVSIAAWTESNGLRSPDYQFTGKTPARFSARLAPQLVGLGLLDAVGEDTIIALSDPEDLDGDGISGKVQLITDPETGELRLGRFGYKAGTASLNHQIAAALNTDIGVMTSVLPVPDCGSNQSSCGDSGPELDDADFRNLVKYNALLGVRPQRNVDDPQVVAGNNVFKQIGCEGCHTETLQTSPYAPFAELRNQTIHPYTDLLLHDMGPGLADNLGEGEASGAEWRTTPLWGLGLSACVTGGVTNPTGMQGDEVCTPDASYLHDGRARTIEEAILWHGGEAQNSKTAYEALNSTDKASVLSFLQSL